MSVSNYVATSDQTEAVHDVEYLGPNRPIKGYQPPVAPQPEDPDQSTQPSQASNQSTQATQASQSTPAPPPPINAFDTLMQSYGFMDTQPKPLVHLMDRGIVEEMIDDDPLDDFADTELRHNSLLYLNSFRGRS